MTLPKAISDAIWTSIMEATAWCGWTDHAREGLISDVQREVAHALSHLTTAAGECDERAYGAEALRVLPELPADWTEREKFAHSCGVGHGARWQHAQDAARIAAVVEQLARYDDACSSLERENAALRKGMAKFVRLGECGAIEYSDKDFDGEHARDYLAEADRIRDERG